MFTQISYFYQTLSIIWSISWLNSSISRCLADNLYKFALKTIKKGNITYNQSKSRKTINMLVESHAKYWSAVVSQRYQVRYEKLMKNLCKTGFIFTLHQTNSVSIHYDGLIQCGAYVKLNDWMVKRVNRRWWDKKMEKTLCLAVFKNTN